MKTFPTFVFPAASVLGVPALTAGFLAHMTMVAGQCTTSKLPVPVQDVLDV